MPPYLAPPKLLYFTLVGTMEAFHPQFRPDTTDKDTANSSIHEKAAGSDIESSRMAASDYDDLPDPDAGKTDEERARLVRSFSSLLFPIAILTASRIGHWCGKWTSG